MAVRKVLGICALLQVTVSGRVLLGLRRHQIAPSLLATDPAASVTDPAAQAAILQTVAREQLLLMEQLNAAQADLNATQQRLAADLISANRGIVPGLSDLLNRSLSANGTAEMNLANLRLYNRTLPLIDLATNATEASSRREQAELTRITSELGSGRQLTLLNQRVDDGTSALHVLQPRLTSLEEEVTQLEILTHHGNITDMVNDAVDEAVTDVVEDVSRGQVLRLPA